MRRLFLLQALLLLRVPLHHLLGLLLVLLLYLRFSGLIHILSGQLLMFLFLLHLQLLPFLRLLLSQFVLLLLVFLVQFRVTSIRRGMLLGWRQFVRVDGVVSARICFCPRVGLCSATARCPCMGCRP